LPASLSADGRTLLKRAEAAVRDADAKVMAKLSTSQQREFKRMLATLGPD
jgi:DNA-binding MarR family transcriptional regulator